MCQDNANRCTEENIELPPRLDVDDAQLGNGFSGFIIIRLMRELPPGQSKELRELAEELQLKGLGTLLDALGRPSTRRLITSVAPEELLPMEQEVARSPWRPLNSLSHYWRVDVRDMVETLDGLVERFARTTGIELAYAELVASDPVVNAGDDPFNPQQGYLDAAPTGIDARWAWTQAGGAAVAG